MPNLKPKFVLTDLVIDEGSLVDKGDNPEAYICLFKNHVEKMEDEDEDEDNPFAKVLALVTKSARTMQEILDADTFHREMGKIREAFNESIFEILNFTSIAEMGPLLQQTVNEFSLAATELAQSISKSHPADSSAIIAIVDQMVDAATFTKVGKSADAPAGINPEALETAIVALKELFVTKAEESTPMPTETTNAKSFDDVLKGLPEAEQAVITTAIEAAKTASVEKTADTPVEKTADQIQIEKLSSEIEMMKEEKFVKRMVDLAKSIALPGSDVDDVAKLLSANFKISEEAGETLAKTFRAQAAQLAAVHAVITKTTGSSAPGVGSVEAQLDEMAKARAATDGIRFEAAYEKILEENDDLAREVLATA